MCLLLVLLCLAVILLVVSSRSGQQHLHFSCQIMALSQTMVPESAGVAIVIVHHGGGGLISLDGICFDMYVSELKEMTVLG